MSRGGRDNVPGERAEEGFADRSESGGSARPSEARGGQVGGQVPSAELGPKRAKRAPSPRKRDRIRAWWRGQRPRDRGVALLVVITWLALMIALVGQFTYGTTVDAAQAANARDELRAHYMARSAVN